MPKPKGYAESRSLSVKVVLGLSFRLSGYAFDSTVDGFEQAGEPGWHEGEF